MAQFRKRPVVIEAVQWTGENLAEVVRFAGNNVRLGVEPDGIVGLSLDRLEVFAVKEQTWVRCPIQHWVIRGVADEFYPCAADVFARTYEPPSTDVDTLVDELGVLLADEDLDDDKWRRASEGPLPKLYDALRSAGYGHDGEGPVT